MRGTKRARRVGRVARDVRGMALVRRRNAAGLSRATNTLRILLVVAGLILAGAAAAQQADGVYPAVLACDGTPSAPPLRVRASITIANGRARYEFPVRDGREIGSGQFSGRRLTLTGGGRARDGAYQASYSGEVTGRGGLLSGAHSSTRFGRRGCQIVLGDG